MAPSRRAFLGSLVATAALAGCTSGPDGGSGGQPTDTESDTPTEEPMDSPTPTSGMEADATVTVGPGGDLRFEPETLEVEAGATVEFVWDSGGHTVTAESQPDGADWTATGQETKSAGFTHTHTFDVAGQYDYICIPHEAAGMVGTVLVGDVSMEAETTTETTSGGGSGNGGGGGYY